MEPRIASSAGLEVEMLAARQGDSVLLSWGPGTDRHYLLVDGGPAAAYEAVSARLGRLPGRALEGLVLTHVDGDHIEGTILLVNDRALDIAIGEIWFNGSHHLVDELGPVHGEILGALVSTRGIPWNDSFDRGAVCSGTQALPVVELAGGLHITVLGPDRPALRRLRDAWVTACRDAGLAFNSPEAALEALRSRPALSPGSAYLGRDSLDVRQLARSRRGTDRSVANASSIVLLVEYEGARLLMAGDATPAVLAPAVDRLLAERNLTSLPLSCFKLPHHGSANNITTELVRLLPANSYLFSSDGSYFSHPDDSAVATVLEFGPPGCELVFNYDTPRLRRWEDEQLRDTYGYRVRYPHQVGGGVTVTAAESM